MIKSVKQQQYNLIDMFLNGLTVKKRSMGITYTYEVWYVPPHLVIEYKKKKGIK